MNMKYFVSWLRVVLYSTFAPEEDPRSKKPLAAQLSISHCVRESMLSWLVGSVVVT
jgi:hypothetical protein